MDPAELMRLAIARASEGIAAGQSPFGCAIAIDGNVVAVEHNTVLARCDVTAHAEVNALRAAGRALQSIAFDRAVVATTCEPCPMCMAALHWAGVAEVHYGATVDDLRAIGFTKLQQPAALLAELPGSQVRLWPNVLREECLRLFAQWRAVSDRTY